MLLRTALVESGLCLGNADSRRMIYQGAVKVNGEVVQDVYAELRVGNLTLQVGSKIIDFRVS